VINPARRPTARYTANGTSRNSARDSPDPSTAATAWISTARTTSRPTRPPRGYSSTASSAPIPATNAAECTGVVALIPASTKYPAPTRTTR
jgi:hypothetical protein